MSPPSKCIPARFGFSVADGEKIDLAFQNDELVLRFVDWRDQPVKHEFLDALAFRWASRPSTPTPRDDDTYEVLDSPWLADEVRDDDLGEAGAFAHYVLCFNAAKVLEVI